MGLKTTIGQLAVNALLPEQYRDYNRVLDKKTLGKLLSEVARTHPAEYPELVYQLNQIGRKAAYLSGGNSFGPSALRMAMVARANRVKLQQQINKLLDDDNLSDEQRNAKLVALMKEGTEDERKAIYEESLAEGNPLAIQLLGAGRGNQVNLAALRGSDRLYADHRGKEIPVPILKSYSQGLTPLEYFASTFGARQGILQTKMAVADAGFYGKQLNQAVHRLMVTGVDDDQKPSTLRGLPVDIEDTDSEGALLAAPAGPYPRNTPLTPKILRDLRDRGTKRILVRSPLAAGSPDGGVYARDVGLREGGQLPHIAAEVGMLGAQAIGEPISQGMLGGKHGGGVAGTGKAQLGFEHINAMIQAAAKFKGSAAHSRIDGVVRKIEPAPAGGAYIWVGQEKHYVGRDYAPLVKLNQQVEAGDVLSEGLPNPSEVVRYKGVGEGRRYFTNVYKKVLGDMGLKVHRRNVELLARGLINHVRMTDEHEDYAPDDVVPYHRLEASWQPRQGARAMQPSSAVGKYLERPYLHYSIGTKIRPSMLPELQEFGVSEVDVHDDPPPFEPEMVRAMQNLQHDEDWVTKQYGSYLKPGLLEAAQRGSTSDQESTSFVPSIVKSVEFGEHGPFKAAPKTKPFSFTTKRIS